MIRNMMNSKKCVVKLGVNDSTIYISIKLKIRNEGKYRNFNESKTTTTECIPESDPF